MILSKYPYNLVLQTPPPPPTDGDTQIDAIPIDNYLFIGLILGLLSGVYFIRKLKV